MNKIKVGVIGTNTIADFFMDGISLVPGYEVVAACAATEKSVNRFAGKYNISHKTIGYKELAVNGLIDMVYIATPNFLHHEIAMFFLENKIAVFCEKPVAVNPTQVSEMISASQKNKTLLFDGIVPLYTENLSKLSDYFKMIMPIRRCVFTLGRYSSRYDAYLRGENPSTFRLEYCSGSLVDMGVYCVSIAVALFGKPENIQASSSKLSNGTDCLGSAIFSYDDFEVIIMHSKVSNSLIQSEVQGENGTIFIDLMNRIYNVHIQQEKGKRKKLGDTGKEGFIYQLEEFKKVFNAGKIESTLVPHKLTMDIADVMFEMRMQSKIKYSCYGE